MNHPRYSVLNLFDPLNAAATPSREVTTPDSLSSSTSDKENAEPSSNAYNNYYDSDKLTMTAFFNRTYKIQPKHYSPVALRKRLIDVGDITVDDASAMMGGLTITEETEGEELADSFDDEEMQLDDPQDDDVLMTPQPKAPSRERVGALQTPHSSSSSHVQQQQSQSVPRTPLADLSLDATPVPRKSGKTATSVFDASTPATSTEEHGSSPVTVVRASHASVAPMGSPLASIINAINLTEHEVDEGVTSDNSKENHAITVVVSEPPDTDDTLNLATACLPTSSTAPLLSETCPPESTTSPGSVPKGLPAVQNPQTLLPSVEDDSTYLSARPRPRLRSKTVSASTPSFDSHRSSVDLQASFNWQLQCPEASFDLLNDRVSFFGGDSFLADTTDDFDVKAEEEMMEALTKRLREKEATAMRDAPTVSSTNRRRSGTVTGALDCTPSSPIITSAQALERSEGSASSSLVDNAPATVVKPPRRRSLLANLMSSPNVEPSSVSRRGSLPLVERSPRTEVAPVFLAPQASLQSLPPDRPSPQGVSSTTSPEVPQSCPVSNEKPTVPSVTPAKSSAVGPTLVPAPVQALRIVKRPKESALAHRHERVASTSSSATNESSSSDAEVRTHPPAQVAPPVVSRVVHKSVFKGVQRPPPGYLSPPMLAPAAIGAPKPAAALLAKQAATAEQEGKPAKASVKSKLTGALGLRGRTVPESEPTATSQSRIQKPVVTSGGADTGATLGRPAASIAQTLISSKSSTSSSIPGAGTRATGLRPPSRFATVSTASGSGIPRPTASSSSSRLPGPTFGVSRSRLPGVGGNTAATVGRSGTVRR